MTTCNICNSNDAIKTRLVHPTRDTTESIETCTDCDHFTDDIITDALVTFHNTDHARSLFTFNFSGMYFIGVKVAPLDPHAGALS